MPSRNRVKAYASDAFYHVYSRGVDKGAIFHDERDYIVFLGLLKRYLGGGTIEDQFGRQYEDLSDRVEVLAFCLLPNHFHLLIYQLVPEGMTLLMRRLMTSYARYYNTRYDRTGPLFQDRYKASCVQNDSYLLHLSRYIHGNSYDAGSTPEDYLYSSYRFYVGAPAPSWLRLERIMCLHGETISYKRFMNEWTRDTAKSKALAEAPST